MIRLIPYLLSLVLLTSVSLKAQIPDTLNPEERILEQNLELLLENTDSEADFTEMAEDIEYLRKNPLNLNSAEGNELARLNLLDALQIENLLEYRRRHGALQSVFELAYIDGFDLPTINRLMPFIRIAPVEKPLSLRLSDLKRGRHQLFLRYQQVLEEQKGYSAISDSALQASPNSRYLGTPQKYYLRYSYSLYNRIHVGFTAEKDAGEEFFSGNRKNGFDYYSGHLSYTGRGILRNVVLGDYSVNMGQGLICFSGMSFGKGATTLNIRKRAQAVRRYTSADENRFFRGIAATAGYQSLAFTAFASHKKIDARPEEIDDPDNEELYIASLQETGIHSTPSEIANRKTLPLTVYGGRLTYNKRRFNLGLSGLESHYGRELGSKNSLYQQFDFQGSRMRNVGADFSVNLPGMLLFGEAGVNQDRSTAWLSGLLLSPAPQLGLAFLYRDYSPGYSGLFLSGFGESSNTQNEKGLYSGFRFQPGRRFTLSGYADVFWFPWLRYRLDKPSQGVEYMLQGDFQLNRNTLIYVRYKTETKLLNPPSSGERFSRPTEQHKQSFRFNIDYYLIRNVRLRSRYEYSAHSFNGKESRGYWVSQDVVWQIPDKGLALYVRYALFDTDDYDSRIYTYENDLLYAFSVPSFYDRGARYYGMLRYSLGRWADLWVKLSQTAYTDRQTISSGLTEIQGNKKTELRVQLRLRW